MLLDLAPLRRHRDFRLLFIGQFVSFFGSMITYVAVPYQVYQLTSSSLLVGLLGAVQLVPLLRLRPVGRRLRRRDGPAAAADRRRGAADPAVRGPGAERRPPAPERGRDLRAGGGDVGGQRLPPADAGGDDAAPGRARRAPRHRGADARCAAAWARSPGPRSAGSASPPRHGRDLPRRRRHLRRVAGGAGGDGGDAPRRGGAEAGPAQHRRGPRLRAAAAPSCSARTSSTSWR